MIATQMTIRIRGLKQEMKSKERTGSKGEVIKGEEESYEGGEESCNEEEKE